MQASVNGILLNVEYNIIHINGKTLRFSSMTSVDELTFTKNI